MLELFDVYVQWLFVMVVYQHEYISLPVVGVLILLWRRRPWWRPVRIGLSFAVVFYLLLLRMHWYSYIAWPLMIAVLGFDGSLERWYAVLRFRMAEVQGSFSFASLGEAARARWEALERAAASVREFFDDADRRREVLSKLLSWRPDADDLRKRGRGFARRNHQLLVLGGFALGVVIVAWVLDLPGDLLLIVAIIAAGAAALLLWISRYRDAEKQFERCVAEEPRLGRYFNYLRKFKGSGRSFLAEHRMVDPLETRG